MSQTVLTPADVRVLTDLVGIPTVSPLESGTLPAIPAAQELFARHAATAGFEAAHYAPPPAESVAGALTPAPVRAAAERFGPAFLASQPNLVLRLGPPGRTDRTLMFNAHLDTVGGDVAVRRAGGRLFGRGAVDMKGPAVAVLAGVREALRRHPALTLDATVLIQSVAGEEGGAMGVYGTRVLCEAGYVGRLNVFAEPSDGAFFDTATSTMTACVEVAGDGSTDDDPAAGHNATVLLGFLSQHLARELGGPVTAAGGKVCVAGLHTGDMHNRVYGTGRLLLNLAYPSAELAGRVERWTAAAFAAGLAEFTDRFGRTDPFRRTAADAASVCRLTWLKRGLPPLANRDPAMERVLAAAGCDRNPDDRPDRSFTCDAVWAQGPGRYVAVFGPGGLSPNGAHTDREFVDLAELDRYAGQVADLTLEFAAHAARPVPASPDRK